MPLWTLIGLLSGKATTHWPQAKDAHGQDGVLGMPRIEPISCPSDCTICVDSCPTQAISPMREKATLVLDYGCCVACQLCVEACPASVLTSSSDWAFGVRSRGDLASGREVDITSAEESDSRRGFRRSLHIRHVDAGSCNGCESELQALNNPFYNLHRLGIFFTPSPRFADLLLVTGPVTQAMHEPLRRTYEAMPEPRWVMAAGTCAVSGGVAAGGYACGNGLEGVLPVDLYLPGCPPNPAAFIQALLMFLERAPQMVTGGRYAG
ncbi:formate hydrogenlyase subunit 7 [mine drainage metagenome]|uniref:Formate hydrogenlyase subunit 7 n=1 Tax=mine drainage metagenome TaxID=410659 RepID=A0A1J5R3U8_9ZZZZ